MKKLLRRMTKAGLDTTNRKQIVDTMKAAAHG
jgi:hypothetical protein